MSVLALIPARSGSKGIPGKNLRKLGGRSLMNRAIDLCNEMRGELSQFAVSSDIDWAAHERVISEEPAWRYGLWIHRPAKLAQDDTPMIAVVQHALAQIPGPEDQIILLLQPTQPFRTPAHVRAAIALLQESQADSVVSVVELPKTHSPEYVWRRASVIYGGPRYIRPVDNSEPIAQPSYRQAVEPAYRCDGTVYAFWRRVPRMFGNIYGQLVQPLLIPAHESCELDTEDDWTAVERRWKASHG